MTTAIQTRGLTKIFRGVTAVRDLDLEIGEGDVFGFIGPNGAGKSTTIKMLSTLLRPSGGMAEICGVSVQGSPERVKPLIGYMPDVLGIYDDMLVGEYLEFFAAAYRIRGTARTARIAEVLELVDLTGKRDGPVKGLSRGMGQRLSLARCLLHDPRVLLLDEPAAGLDPRARIEFKELVQELRRMGKTLLISSHILSEIGEMCNAIGIIEKGELLFAGDVAEARLKLRAGRVVRIRVRADSDDGRETTALLDSFRGHPDIHALKEAGPGEVLVQVSEEKSDISFLVRTVLTTGLELVHFSEAEMSIEDIFLEVTKGEVA